MTTPANHPDDKPARPGRPGFDKDDDPRPEHPITEPPRRPGHPEHPITDPPKVEPKD